MTASIRPAVRGDQLTIWWMVFRAGLDPTSLHWPQFLVAEDDGQIVGIGQIRPHPGCPELGSLVVRKDQRGTGLGGRLVRELLATRPPPIYLECESSMATFYERYGFREIAPADAPHPLRRKSTMGNRLFGWMGIRIVVMVYPAEAVAGSM